MSSAGRHADPGSQIGLLLPHEQLRVFIHDRCLEAGVQVPANWRSVAVDLSRAYATSGAAEALEELRGIAEEHGGRCLSDVYKDGQGTLEWACSEGHTWFATASSVRQGYWCRSCSLDRRRRSEQDAKAYAESKDGEFLGLRRSQGTSLAPLQMSVWPRMGHDLEQYGPWILVRAMRSGPRLPLGLGGLPRCGCEPRGQAVEHRVCEQLDASKVRVCSGTSMDNDGRRHSAGSLVSQVRAHESLTIVWTQSTAEMNLCRSAFVTTRPAVL